MNMSRSLRRIRVEVAGAGRMIVNAPPPMAMTWFNAWYRARLQLLQRMASPKSWDFDRAFSNSVFRPLPTFSHSGRAWRLS